MILLILYYIYKWMTVPWSYYESARSRRIIHFNASYPSADSTGDGKKKSASRLRHEEITNELRRHELIGLIWVLASPAIAGYTLQFSRYFLSDYDKYMSSFNVVVFVLAASIKPLSHAAQLLRERTLYLQSEIQINETQVTRLQKKLDLLEDELFSLRQAFATKKDLGQVTDGLSPTLQQLTKAMKRFEKKEQSLRSWSEDRFTNLDEKLREFDQFICYQIDQEQRMSKHSTITTLILLPINITFWIAKSMTGFLPVSRALLGDASSTNDHLYRQHLDYKPATKSLPHPTTTSTRSKSSSSSSGKHITHPDIISPPTTPDPNIAH
ncbi:hypothetical protein BJ944DRAFT_161408 [Cunninghamella echinulata]|nr:hypothetical protein BJ944DRAFT_161408 [Cunninghamella echinulata]